MKKTRQEIAASGYASATMSSGGGSRSYTRNDISKITEAISALTSELKKLRAMLKNVGSQYVRDMGLIPGPGRPPGEENGNPIQYSCLENSMGRGAWRATVHEVTKSQTRLRD